MQVWIDQNTASPFTDIDLGVGIAAVGDVEQTVANENTLPSNIAWTFARGEDNAQLLGNIEPGKGKSLWIRRHAGPARADSSYAGDNYILGFKVRRTGATTQPPPGPGPPPPSGNDKFGIRMIYQTNTSASVSTPMYINMSNPEGDCRLSTNGTITKNADGSLAMGASARIRLYADASGCASDIYTLAADTYDHDTWATRGYARAANDWKNVEITGHFKCVGLSTESERKLYLYSRTWRHNTNVGGGCSGAAYKGVVYGATGELKFHKEQFHNGDQPCGDRNIYLVPNVSIPRTDNNKWYGFKVMMWNYQNPNSTNPNSKHVHLELWLDLDANNTWVKYAEKNDEGDWYAGAPDASCPGDSYCGGNQDQIIQWGGPITEIRWDGGYTNVHFRYLSCREIIPGSSVTPPPPGPTPPPPGPSPGPTPPPPPSGPGVDAFGTKNIYTTAVGSTGWAATTWTNGHSRTFGDPDGNCEKDPYDNRMTCADAGDPRVTIDGNGIMKAWTVPGEPDGSPRVSIDGSWQNVECTVYFRYPTGMDGGSLDFRMKNQHYCMPSEDPEHFGGYLCGTGFGSTGGDLRKEKAHDNLGGYSDRQNHFDNDLDPNVWYGIKGICYNVSNGVKLETWMDFTDGLNGGTWQKMTEGIDDGTWEGAPDTQAFERSSIRTNVHVEDGFVEYKKWTIRKIAPPG